MPDMRAKLRELGYVEGRDLKFEIRAANEDFERLPDLAADLVRSGVDLIVAVSSPAIRAAENATSTIPIVMLSGTDPVAGTLLARTGDLAEANVRLQRAAPELGQHTEEIALEMGLSWDEIGRLKASGALG